MTAKVACAVFALVLLITAALLIAGVFTATEEAEKTFSGAHFISIPQVSLNFGENELEEQYHGRISKHTLVVSGGDAGRARG